jgi:hypothetical protein
MPGPISDGGISARAHAPAGVINVWEYALSGDGSQANPFTGWASKLPQGNNLVYYFEGANQGQTWYSDDKFTITGDKCRIVGDGRMRSIVKSKSGQTIFEFTTGDISFSGVESLQLLGNGGSGHGIYMHDGAAPPQSVKLQDLWIASMGGSGIRLGLIGTNTNPAINSFWNARFTDIYITGCGDHEFAAESVGPDAVFTEVGTDNIATGKFGFYFDNIIGSFTGCNAGDNTLPSVASPTTDGGGGLRVTGIAGGFFFTWTGGDLEAFGADAIDLTGAGGQAIFKGTQFLDNSGIRSVGTLRSAIKWDNVNADIEIDNCTFNTLNGWRNGNALHGHSFSTLIAIGRQSPATAWLDDLATQMPVSRILGSFDGTFGYITSLSHLQATALDIGLGATAGNPWITYYNTTPCLYPQVANATNVALIMGAHWAIPDGERDVPAGCERRCHY